VNIVFNLPNQFNPVALSQQSEVYYYAVNDDVHGLGDEGLNKSISSQLKNIGKDDAGNKLSASRVYIMDLNAENTLEELGPDAKMNVNLHRCK